jgi:hypothetical protein
MTTIIIVIIIIIIISDEINVAMCNMKKVLGHDGRTTADPA